MPMIFPINQSLFERCMPIAPLDWTPGEATQAVDGFGPLAAWWLPRHILELAAIDQTADEEFREFCRRAAASPPAIPSEPGTAPLLLAGGPSHKPEALLGFVLPVQWVAQTQREHRLPKGLLDVAQSVNDVLIANGILLPQASGRLKLQLPDSLASVDLSQYQQATWRSAWLPLAGALVALRGRGDCDPTVWATGQYDSTLQPVSNIRLKFQAAQRWGVTRFYFPEGSSDIPDMDEQKVLHPLSYKNAKQATLRELLNPYLDALSPVNQGLHDKKLTTEELASRFLRLFKQPFEVSDPFFMDHCLPRMEQQLHDSLEQQLAPWPTTLVTIASNTIAAACLAVAALRPKRCIILHTKEASFSDQAEKIKTFTNHTVPDGEIHLVAADNISTFAEQSKQEVVRLTAGAMIGEVVYDLTPGTKEMTLAILLEVARPGAPLIYCRHKTTADNGPIAFTQNYLVITAPELSRTEEFVPPAPLKGPK